MKHTSLLLSLLLSVILMSSFSAVEAATKKTSKAKTSSSKKTKTKKTAASTTKKREYKDVSSLGCKGGDADVKAKNQCDQQKGQWDPTGCLCLTANSSFDDINKLVDVTATGISNRCFSQLQQLSEQCEADVGEAMNSCDKDQDTGIQTQTGQLQDFAVEIGKQVSVKAPCSGYAKHVGALNAAVAAFGQVCSSSRDTCMTSCKRAISSFSETNALSCSVDATSFATLERNTRTQLNKCNALSAEVAKAADAVKNIVTSVKGASSCETQASAQVSDYCKANPTALGCSNESAQCADPTFAASNPICFCRGPDAASNPQCRTALKSVGGEPLSTMPLTGSGATSSESDPVFGSTTQEWAGDPNYKKKSDGGGDEVGGKKGGRAVEGGSGSGSGGSGDGSAAAGDPAAGPQINNGFRGAGSGGAFGSGGSGSYEGGGAGGAYGADGSASADPNAGPDLRQFLPGGKFDPGSRGVAGMTGPDGITGPHDSVWRKVKNRYQAQQPTFLGQ